MADRIGGIFGTGRSGTTWVGAVLGAHTDVAYMFEPIGRSKDEGSPLREWEKAIIEGGHVRVEELRRALLKGDVLWDKPPFVKKPGQRHVARVAVWAAARKWRGLNGFYRALYRPSEDAYVLFKEVSHERLTIALCERSSMPLIYLVRHPLGFIASMLAGKTSGLMSTKRPDMLGRLLADAGSPLLDLYPDIDDRGLAARLAVLWRFDVERVVPAVETAAHAKLVVYEDVCRQPEEAFTSMAAHLGLTWDQGAQQMLNVTTGNADRPGPELVREKYFSIYRHPKDSMDAWKERLSADDREAAEEVIDGSPLLQSLRERGVWA